MQSVLILNATYQPLSVVPFKRAVILMQQGKAIPLDGSGRFYESANGAIEIPYVILMKYAVKQGVKPRKSGFSRRGVLIRDNHVCAYCGGLATTIDHVVPRALGGLSTFENCVAACLKCNGKKADHTLKDLGWKTPMVPKASRPSHLSSLLEKARRNPAAYDTWKYYIHLYDPSLAQRKTPQH